MGKFWDALYGPLPPTPPAPSPPPAPTPKYKFAIGDDFATWRALVAGYSTGKATRREAMAVPAVKAARDKFCALGTLPLHAYNADGERIDRQLLTQPESLKGLVRSVTMAYTIDDLFFESSSLWQVILRDSTGFPSVVERIPHGLWNQDPESGVIRVGNKELRNEDTILFTSPNDPILTSAAGTIKALLRLEATASMYMESPEMTEYFMPNEGQEIDDDEVQDFLTAWAAARRARTTGYIPAGIERHEVNRMTAQDLQLSVAREFGVSEVSRLTGLSPNWLALNITTRTYSNMQDERRDFIDFPASPYIHAIEERLSLGDVTPRGQYVRLNLDGFLRANTLDRMQAYDLGIRVGAYTLDEVRALENRPPLTPAEKAAIPTAAPTPGVTNG